MAPDLFWVCSRYGMPDRLRHHRQMRDELITAVAFGADQPRRLLTAWLGAPRPDAAANVERPSVTLPRPLVRWHEDVAPWGYASVMQQNRVPDARELDGDVLLAGIETQSVWLWGVREGDPNPWVLERENEPREPWTETGERLNEFLWHFTLVELVLGSRYGLAANDVSDQQWRTFCEGWTPVEAKQWRWPGPAQRLFARGSALAWTTVNDHPDAPVTPDSLYSIFVSARSNEALTDMDRFGIVWDWDSRLGDPERT